MGTLLDLAYVLLGLLASPYILIRMAASRRWRAGFLQRLGFVPRREGEGPCVWIHAVSVGEAKAVRPLVDLMRSECPSWEVRISTTTNTGQQVAREAYGAGRCLYFPLDLSFVVRRTMRRVRPDVMVLVELELWPNFLRVARVRGVPVAVVNGRMREERVERYRALGFLFRPGMERGSGNVFCVQNETYRRRFERAGVPGEMIRVTGNMKYDAVRTTFEAERVEGVRGALGLGAGERVWVAGCTWPGEEAICLRAHRRLQAAVPALRLVIAPRHIERAGEVAREIEAAGYACRRRTAGSGGSDAGTVGLLDTVGELGYLYAIADFVFVGKSLAARGGHNVLEPVAAGATPVFGPFTENFEEEARLLLDAGGAERVEDEASLGEALRRLAEDADLREGRIRRGREALEGRRGASRGTLKILRRLLEKAGGS